MEIKQHAVEHSVGHRDKWKCNIPKFMGCSKNTSGREIHSDKCLSQEIRKVPNKQPKFTPQGIRKITSEAQSQ